MQEEVVKRLLNEALEENKDLFLIDFQLKPNNEILVIIDGDQGVSVNDCIEVSRKIEHNLDREEEDFSLEVASAGVTTPLKLPRQFKKNINRRLSVKTVEQKIEGDLIEVTEEAITLKWKTREPKKVGKGKTTVQKEAVIPYQAIEEAKVMITF